MQPKHPNPWRRRFLARAAATTAGAAVAGFPVIPAARSPPVLLSQGP